MSEITPAQKEQLTTLSINIKSLGALYGAYMPFLKTTGLFVPTRNTYSVGDKLRLRLEVLGDPQVHDIVGEVAWITPTAAQGNRAAGVGLAFVSGDLEALKSILDLHLTSMMGSKNPTHTM